MKTLRQLMQNTPLEVRTKSQQTTATVISAKKAVKKSLNALVLTVRCKAITEKVFYDVVIELYPTEIHKNVYERPSLDLPAWVQCSCFTGDTLIPLADGRSVPIKDLVGVDEFFVYSYDTKTKKNVIGRGHSCEIKEHSAQLVEVAFDNGTTIKCTPDHKFLMRDGETYVEAKDLTPGASLQAMYRRLWSRGKMSNYEQVLQDDGYEWTHKISDDFNLKHNLDKETKGTFRHHKDFNKLNNSPKNIQRMFRADHFKAHHDHMVGDGNPMRKESVKLKKVSTDNRLGHNARASIRMKSLNPMHNAKSLEKMLSTSKERGLYDLDRLKKMHTLKNTGWQNDVSVRQKQLVAEGRHHGVRALPIIVKKLQSEGRLFSQTRRHKDLCKQRALEMAKNGIHPFQVKREKIVAATKKRLNDPAFQTQMIRKRAIAGLRKHILEHGRLIPEKFDRVGYPKLETIKQRFDLDSLLMEATNHKVISVKFIEEKQDVYCFTVDDYENFVIDLDGGVPQSSGVVVHNCPFFLFHCEYALARVGSSEIKYSNGKPPYIKNPKYVPYLCKHLTKAASEEILKQVKKLMTGLAIE